MGWQQNVFTTLIIEEDVPGAGLFIYSGPPAAGNLVGSIAAAAGTDNYGNAYLQGITLYSGITGTYVAFNIYGSGFLNAPIGCAWYSASTYAGPYSIGGTFRNASGGWVSSPIYGQGADEAADFWNYVTSFGTGWSNRGTPWAELAYRQVASPALCVQVKGWCSVSADSDTTLFTLPPAYRPASSQTLMAWSVTAGQMVQFNVGSDGVIGAASASLPATGNYWFDSIISLDI